MLKCFSPLRPFSDVMAQSDISAHQNGRGVEYFVTNANNWSHLARPGEIRNKVQNYVPHYI